MLLVGMDVVIPMLFPFMILNPLPEGCISHRQCTKPLKPIILWYVLLFPVYSIIILILSLRLIITVILIAMKCYIMWMEIL